LTAVFLSTSGYCSLNLVPLLSAAGSANKARTLNLSRPNRISQTDPLWPVQTFLTGEVYRLRGEKRNARESFRTLAEWAAADPCQDGRGGSSLAIMGLWRWLQIMGDAPGTSDEFLRLADSYEKLKNTALTKGMFHLTGHGTFFSTLPQIQEDIRRRLAYLAWYFKQTEKARQYFSEYLQVARTQALDPIGEALMKDLLASDVSSGQAHMMWAKRLYHLGLHDDAMEIFESLRDSKDLSIRSEAGLYLAKIKRIKREPRTDIMELLGTVYKEGSPEIAEKALYDRAMMSIREGQGKDVNQFQKDLLTLTKQFPQGSLHDNALYQLARYFHSTGDLQQAMVYYGQLRDYKGENDRIDSAHFYPAISLYAEGKPEESIELLKALMQKREFGPMRFNTLFWLGRISAEAGRQDIAKTYFRQVIADSPFHYYAIRSRMYLNMGTEAKKNLRPDKKTHLEIRDAFRNSLTDTKVPDSSPYHRRINDALDTGLYRAALEDEQKLQQAYPSERIENLPIEKLDRGMFAGLAVIQSLRQDALAAKETDPSPANRFQIAGKIGQTAQDWPLVMDMSLLAGEYYEATLPQQDKRYAATAYPPVFKSTVIRESRHYNIPPELLYSMMRRESMFYPLAFSVSSAMGLLQFIPRTFSVLDERWNLLETSGTGSAEEFLFDPERSIALGARWLRQELLNRYKKYGEKGILFAVMDHNAGYPAVREWRDNWEAMGRDTDIEYMIETVRFGETRLFARRVITDMIIVEAAGLFDE
jgi:soluble lytic murein transglycosylase-like protein/TolA-binding protein